MRLPLFVEADHPFHQGKFFLDEAVDVLFDGPFGDELEDLDAAVLADPTERLHQSLDYRTPYEVHHVLVR